MQYRLEVSKIITRLDDKGYIIRPTLYGVDGAAHFSIPWSRLEQGVSVCVRYRVRSTV